MKLLNWLSKRRFPYEPLISVSISREALLHNFDKFRSLPGVGMIAPVMKSNAYGHGLFEVAEILHESHGTDIPFTVVDSYFEAVALRARGCKHPLLIIGYTRPETIAKSYLSHIAFTVTSMDALRLFIGDKPPAPEGSNNGTNGKSSPSHIPPSHRVLIHLKIDTGMRRQGILPEEIPEAIEIIKGNESLVLEGICTHFSDADNLDESFTEAQINTWNKLARVFRADFPSLKYIHAANTDGSRYAKDIEGNVTRLGIGLYGISENPKLINTMNLQPALEVRTILTGIKKLASGETIGYSNSFRAERDMTVATIPMGYFEGLDRRLSSGNGGEARGFVLVGADRTPCPIIGRVSMNITSIDVSAVPGGGAKVGDVAVAISAKPNDPNSISSIARACGTIPYEIAVKIPAHLKRVIVA